jgi:hypothetical protein
VTVVGGVEDFRDGPRCVSMSEVPRLSPEETQDAMPRHDSAMAAGKFYRLSGLRDHRITSGTLPQASNESNFGRCAEGPALCPGPLFFGQIW